MGLAGPEIIAQGVQPDAAVEFWKQRAKLTDAEAKALGAEAKQRAFYVTGLAKHDLVQLVSDGLQSALENGETLADFKKRIAAAIAAQGWHDHRVENIFRTNMQTAYSAGRYKKMQAVKASRPYWQYLAILDKRVRPSHAILHELVYPADHEFWASNYPPNGFRCRCVVRTLSAKQVEKQGLTVQKAMPEPGVWTDPKTGMEYFVHFPGADKGFRNNPGADWVKSGLDLKKYPDLNTKSYEEQRGPTSKRPAPVKTYEELGDGIKSRLGHFATNNGIHTVDFTKDPKCFMATWCEGRFKVSTHTHSMRNGKTFNAAEELKSAWNKLAEGKDLTWNEEYACESLWHEITHNRQKRSSLGDVGLRYMETVTQWTARRTYHEMLESLGGSADHQADIKKNGLGYGHWVKNFDRLLEALGIDEAVLLSFMQDMIATRQMNEYGQTLVDFLAKESGAKKRAVRSALSQTHKWDFEQVLRENALIK